MSENETIDFFSFGLNEDLLKGITAAGFKVPSEIQEKAIPVILSGADVVGQAHTGTGKTAAFGLPAMNNMDLDHGIEMLVVVPTRELAMQVSDEIFRLGKFAGVRTGTVFGGQSYSRQIKLINQGIHVLVATPGRLIDLLSNGRFDNFAPSIVVLDEADEMLDMGFLDDIKEIFNYLPEERQTLLFSATMPPPIRKLAEKILNDPINIKTNEEDDSTNQDIEQLYCVIEESEREDAVIRLMDTRTPEKAILFCRTRSEVDRLSNSLGARGFNAKGLHGDMEQAQRNRVMQGFRDSQIDILIATDVASRGLDVSDVTHVFNYHMPFDTKSYIHRVGRTGRAGKKGTAITLVTPREYNQMERIKRQSGANIQAHLVPSLKEMRMSQISRFSDQLRECEVSSEAVTMLDRMKYEMDIDELAARLATLLMQGQQQIEGPDRIGLSESQLKHVMKSGREGKNGRFKKRKRSFAKKRKSGDNKQ